MDCFWCDGSLAQSGPFDRPEDPVVVVPVLLGRRAKAHRLCERRIALRGLQTFSIASQPRKIVWSSGLADGAVTARALRSAVWSIVRGFSGAWRVVIYVEDTGRLLAASKWYQTHGWALRAARAVPGLVSCLECGAPSPSMRGGCLSCGAALPRSTAELTPGVGLRLVVGQ